LIDNFTCANNSDNFPDNGINKEQNEPESSLDYEALQTLSLLTAVYSSRAKRPSISLIYFHDQCSGVVQPKFS